MLGSLLLAAHNPDGELVYVGDVGTGFTDAARRRLLELLAPLHREDPPFIAALSAPARRRPAGEQLAWGVYCG